MKKGVIVIDCGAGSVRAVAVDETGRVAGIVSEANGATRQLGDWGTRGLGDWGTGKLGNWGTRKLGDWGTRDLGNWGTRGLGNWRTSNLDTQSPSNLEAQLPSCLVWDFEEIFAKAIRVTRKLVDGLRDFAPGAITVTSFGVDGTFVDREGGLLYPVISWQCSRTADVAGRIASYMDPAELRRINGLNSYHFNTLYRMLWFRENYPEIIEKAHAFLFMPSLLIHRLCGAMVTDMTMAGTSMMTSLKGRCFSDWILGKAGIPGSMFPSPMEPGMVAGGLGDWVTRGLGDSVARKLGLKKGLPVVVAGHDTQFALFASAREENQPVLSSGTWEILSVRTPVVNMDRAAGLSIELDAVPGFYNPLSMWVASGAVEWAVRTFYPNLAQRADKYDVIIREASQVPPGCEGLSFVGDLYAGESAAAGSFRGIRQHMGPAYFLRAVFEALAYRLADGIKLLEQGCSEGIAGVNVLEQGCGSGSAETGNGFNSGEKGSGFKYSSLVISGGGSKNQLWNQIRADVLGIPLHICTLAEATALGAAMFAMPAAGVFSHPQAVKKHWNIPHTVVEPGGGLGY